MLRQSRANEFNSVPKSGADARRHRALEVGTERKLCGWWVCWIFGMDPWILTWHIVRVAAVEEQVAVAIVAEGREDAGNGHAGAAVSPQLTFRSKVTQRDKKQQQCHSITGTNVWSVWVCVCLKCGRGLRGEFVVSF